MLSCPVDKPIEHVSTHARNLNNKHDYGSYTGRLPPGYGSTWPRSRGRQAEVFDSHPLQCQDCLALSSVRQGHSAWREMK